MKISAYITRLCRRFGRTRVFRITAVLVAILQVTVSFLSCTGKEKPLPVDIVRTLVDAEIRLPSGALYFSEAPRGTPEYLPKCAYSLQNKTNPPLISRGGLNKLAVPL